MLFKNKAEFSDENLKMSPFQKPMFEVSMKVVNERDAQIKKVLAENGYAFENDTELLEFAANRCVIAHYGKHRSLAVDSVVLCEWWDTMEIDYTTVNCNVTIGKHPNEIIEPSWLNSK